MSIKSSQLKKSGSKKKKKKGKKGKKKATLPKQIIVEEDEQFMNEINLSSRLTSPQSSHRYFAT